ncbi:MAG: DUF4344 domain-containing metallopeptidase [Xanthobacteraceae bacterium]
MRTIKHAVVSHEMGHAVFDLSDVPLFGRPEDDADQFAAHVMIRIGKDDARRLRRGRATQAVPTDDALINATPTDLEDWAPPRLHCGMVISSRTWPSGSRK